VDANRSGLRRSRRCAKAPVQAKVATNYGKCGDDLESVNCLQKAVNCLRKAINCLREAINCLRKAVNCLREAINCL
jgi:hypothetical protein